MKTVRKNTFETNSSSSHSLTIDYTSDFKLPKTQYNGEEYHISGGEYGWGYDSYTSPDSKISYTAVEVKSTNNEALKNLLEEVLKEVYGCGEIIYDFDTDKYDAYIDHESLGLVSHEVGLDKDKLKRFLFGNSELVIDNDNH